MSLCAQFLSAARKVAKQSNGWTDRGCAVLGGSTKALDGYYFVESYEGKIVWEGSAHCRYCARAEAISKMTEDVDPTPWCGGCGAMRKDDCHCGPIAANE